MSSGRVNNSYSLNQIGFFSPKADSVQKARQKLQQSSGNLKFLQVSLFFFGVLVFRSSCQITLGKLIPDKKIRATHRQQKYQIPPSRLPVYISLIFVGTSALTLSQFLFYCKGFRIHIFKSYCGWDSLVTISHNH